MTVNVGVPAESCPGERRVALTPKVAQALIKAGAAVVGERRAGEAAGYPDGGFAAAGCSLAERAEIWQQAEVVLQVRVLGANPEAGRRDLPAMRPGQVVIGLGEPLTAHREVKDLAAAGVTHFALELLPRITRAQSMDVLSSMASLAGYKAVLLAASALPKIFPLMMTAAGTLAPARVLVLGAGVAGLQAIATAKRLGAVVSGYDVRAAVKEQVESLGGKFVVLEVETQAEGAGGYAKALDETTAQRQRDALAAVIAEQDVLITTAAVPGQKAPLLVTEEMANRMAPGSVIVDLAAERGGNTALTRPGETVVHRGISVLGPLNVAGTLPFHASQMLALNFTSFCKLLLKEGALALDLDDEIVRETLVTRDGQVVHPRVAERIASATA